MVALTFKHCGTRLESIIWGLFCVFLNYRSELAKIWRQDTETIHDHKKMQLRSAIVGCNGRMVFGAYFQLVFSTDLAHFLYSRSTIHPHTFCLDLILLRNLLQLVLLYKISPHKYLMFRTYFPHIVLESRSQFWICHAVMIQLTWC